MSQNQVPAKVVWCKKLENTTSFRYGVGVEFLKSGKKCGLKGIPSDYPANENTRTANTIGFHYGKHHTGYVDNLSKLIAGTEYPDLPLEKIIIGTAGRAEKTPIFNAAQTWNHTFYLKSMRSKGGGCSRPPH